MGKREPRSRRAKKSSKDKTVKSGEDFNVKESLEKLKGDNSRGNYTNVTSSTRSQLEEKNADQQVFSDISQEDLNRATPDRFESRSASEEWMNNQFSLLEKELHNTVLANSYETYKELREGISELEKTKISDKLFWILVSIFSAIVLSGFGLFYSEIYKPHINEFQDVKKQIEKVNRSNGEIEKDKNEGESLENFDN